MPMSKYLLFRVISILLRLLILETKLVTNSAQKSEQKWVLFG